MAVVYWQRAASYGQTRVFDIFQYVASQSTPRPRPAQPPQNDRGRQPPTVPNRQPPATVAQLETEEPPSPTSSTSSSQHQKEVAEATSQLLKLASPSKASNIQRANFGAPNIKRSNSGASNVQRANS